jgi:hypothetical protein
MSSDDDKKNALDCWRRGNKALSRANMSRENWDYAIQMYRTCVKLDPDNIMHRQSLQGAEDRKLQEKTSRGGIESQA